MYGRSVCVDRGDLKGALDIWLVCVWRSLQEEQTAWSLWMSDARCSRRGWTETLSNRSSPFLSEATRETTTRVITFNVIAGTENPKHGVQQSPSWPLHISSGQICQTERCTRRLNISWALTLRSHVYGFYRPIIRAEIKSYNCVLTFTNTCQQQVNTNYLLTLIFHAAFFSLKDILPQNKATK